MKATWTKGGLCQGCIRKLALLSEAEDAGISGEPGDLRGNDSSVEAEKPVAWRWHQKALESGVNFGVCTALKERGLQGDWTRLKDHMSCGLGGEMAKKEKAQPVWGDQPINGSVPDGTVKIYPPQAAPGAENVAPGAKDVPACAVCGHAPHGKDQKCQRCTSLGIVCTPATAPIDVPAWKVGERVLFAHQAARGRDFEVVVSAVHFREWGPMVSIEGMSGEFAARLFVAAPIELPAIDLEPLDVSAANVASAPDFGSAEEVLSGLDFIAEHNRQVAEKPDPGRARGTIQFHPEELDYVNAKLHSQKEERKSFLGSFLDACLRADAENYPLLRPAPLALMEKYPAAPERLRMEREDHGAGERS
ncbi:MAG: hypothetical protein ACRD4V_07655 [Candidatus Acidiferrales bacterium]